jgi:hypothetical protein
MKRGGRAAVNADYDRAEQGFRFQGMKPDIPGDLPLSAAGPGEESGFFMSGSKIAENRGRRKK